MSKKKTMNQPVRCIVYLSYYEESYEMKKKIYTDKNSCCIYSFLGIAKCKYMLEEYYEALNFITKAMELSEETTGTHSIDTAKIYYYVAKIYQELECEKETMMYFDQSLRITENLLGKRNNFTLLVSIEYFAYKILKEKCEISKEVYDEFEANILLKERPVTVTFNKVYQKMNEFSDKLKIENSQWKKYIKKSCE